MPPSIENRETYASTYQKMKNIMTEEKALISSNFHSIDKFLAQIGLVSFDDALTAIFGVVTNVEEYGIVAKQCAEKLCQSFKLPIDCLAAITLYTIEWAKREDSLYYLMNQSLRNQDRHLISCFAPYMKLLMEGLQQLPPYRGTVWRAIQNVDLREVYQKGKVVVFSGFTSCTTDVSVAGGVNFFGQTGIRTLLNIQVELGYLISPLSLFQKESEVLLPVGCSFNVVDVLDAGSGIVIIQLQQKLK